MITLRSYVGTIAKDVLFSFLFFFAHARRIKIEKITHTYQYNYYYHYRCDEPLGQIYTRWALIFDGNIIQVVRSMAVGDPWKILFARRITITIIKIII